MTLIRTTPKRDWGMVAVDSIDRFYTEFFGTESDEVAEKMLVEGWQRRVTLEALKAITGSVRWPRQGMTFARSKFVGGLFGHAVSQFDSMCKPEVWETICKNHNSLEKTVLKDQTDFEPLSLSENLFAEAEPLFRKAVAKGICQALKQTTGEQIQFFEGYSKALRCGSVTDDLKGAKETSRTTAYQLLAVFGPYISHQWNCVPDVHRFLTNFMGSARAGGLDRTEKICKSIGLRFRDPGRPPADALPSPAPS